MPDHKTQKLFYHGTTYGMLAKLEYPANIFNGKDATFAIGNMLGQLHERIYDAFTPKKPYRASITLPVYCRGKLTNINFDVRVDVPEMQASEILDGIQDETALPDSRFTDGTITLEAWMGPMQWRYESWSDICLRMLPAKDYGGISALPDTGLIPKNATVDDVIRKYGIKRETVEMEMDTRENCPGEFYCMSLMEFSNDDIRDWLERN